MDQKIVHEFSRLRVLSNRKSDPPSPSRTKKKLVSTGNSSAASKNMDALVHDLNTALELDEANNSSANAASGSGAAGGNRDKRRVWRRRCKSTSNLACLNANSSNPTGDSKKNQSQNSEDSSSSTEDDTRAVILTNDRGTSSLQLSDSEEEKIPRPSLVHTHSTRRSNKTSSQHSAAVINAENSNQIQTEMDQGANSNNKVHANTATGIPTNDTDSVNENFSPVRPQCTKRKRKFKRMALDPDNTSAIMLMEHASTSKTASITASKTGTIKRKKVRSKSACDSSSATSKSRSATTLKSPNAPIVQRQRQVSTANVVPGKRKRSSREKSVEPDLMLVKSSAPSHSMITEEPSIVNDAMDCDDEGRRSSSSLSSSDWEEAENTEGEATFIPGLREDDGEADDEQSDWPGPETGSVYGGFTDEDEAELDSLSQQPLVVAALANSAASSKSSIGGLEIGNLEALTSTARQAYLARMKRLADCVPGREIRAGSRRLRNPQSGFKIKSSSSEQLSRFLQDPQRTEMRLSVLRAADRNKIAQMATLYSLQLRYDGPNILILAKTGKTVKMDGFIVPKSPAAKAKDTPVDVKRRRRTPPPSPEMLDDLNPISGFAASNSASMMISEGHVIQTVSNPSSGALTDSPIDEKSPSAEITRRQSN